MKTALVIDDHPLVQVGCAYLLRSCGYDCIREARTMRDSLPTAASTRPELIILDIGLPDGSGLDLISPLIDAVPKVRILTCSMNDSPIFAERALEAGAHGFVSKNDSPDLFREAVKTVEAGDTYLGHALSLAIVTQRLHGRDREDRKLSDREAQMMDLLAEGSDLSAIAASLGVSYRTAATLSASLKSKLGARNFRELVQIASKR